MDTFSQIAMKIIKEQESIIGPMAWREAERVNGLKVVNAVPGGITLEGDPKTIIDDLVARYDRLFGRASHEVSLAAASALLAELSADDIPSSLRL